MSTDPARRDDVGKIVPRVPRLPPREGVDRGAAGSLIQVRDRERAQRVADRPSPARDWHLYVAAVMLLAAAVGAGVGWHLLSASSAALLLLTLAVATAAAAVLVVLARYLPSDLEQSLEGAIRRERHLAQRLDTLRGLGWIIFHDRLLPGTEHRVPHLLAGPAGIIIASPAPSNDALRLGGLTLYAGATPLDEWFATRWWEAESINTATAEHLSAWSWTGPVFPLVVVDEQRYRTPRWIGALATRRTEARVPGHPLAYTRIAIRDVDQVRHWITALPSPLGRITSAQLASALEEMCPPAATRD